MDLGFSMKNWVGLPNFWVSPLYLGKSDPDRFSQNTGDELVSKRVILFDALTEFMKKQALRNAHEIVRYYAKKYRKAKGSKNPGGPILK